MIDELERLAKLWQDGILTDEEFAEQKQRILAMPLNAPSKPVAQDAAPADLASSDAEIAGDDATEPEAPDFEDDFGFDDLNALAHDSAIEGTPQQAEPAPPETGSDDLSLDDLNAMLDDALAEEVSVAADPSPSAAPSEDRATAEGELSLDDINAMLDGALADADEVAQPAELAATDASAPTNADLDLDDLNAMLDGALAEASAAAEAPPPEADLSLDDINALLDDALTEASTVITDTSSPAPQPDTAVMEPEEPAGLDDLDALLDGALADAGISPAEAMHVEDSTAGTSSPVKSADRLGDLNSMLDDVLADADFAPAEALSADSVADSAELARSRTEEAPASAPEKGSAPADNDDAGIEESAAPAIESPPALPATSRKPRFQLAALLARIKRLIRPSGKHGGGGLALRVRRAIALLSHIRLPFRLPQPVLLGIGALTLFAGTLGLSYTIATASFAPSQAAEPPKAEQDHAPETAPLAEDAAETEASPEEAADTGEETAANEGAEGAPDGVALMADASEPRIIRDSAEIARKCPVIDALTRAYAGALSAKFRSPDESFGVKQGSGFVRGRTGESQACLIEITRPGGAARLCKVAGIVQIPGQATAAYLGDGQKDVICAGDPTFAQEG